MSLINDALKRARDAERNRPAAPPHPPLAPVDTPRRQHPAARWLLLAIVVTSILLAAASFWKWAHHESDITLAQPVPAPRAPASSTPREPASNQPYPVDPTGSPTPHPPAPAKRSDPATADSPDRPDPSTMVPVPGTIPPPDSDTTTGDPADALVASDAVRAPTEPELRLQSIIYRLRNPAVVINGEMLHVGEPIAGGVVTEIQRQAVTIQRGESNIVLQLPSL
jgi:hypothetical protein